MSDQTAPVVNVVEVHDSPSDPEVHVEATRAHVETAEEMDEEEPRAFNWASVIPWIIVAILVVIIALISINALGSRSSDVDNKAPAATDQPSVVQPTTGISEQTVLDLGGIGAFHAVYDYDRNQWTLGIWEESTTRAGTGLSEFKLKATSVSFVMPGDGQINNSAGHISVNGQEWVLGNPAQSPEGETIIKKGDSITIWTDGPNESAGFQIWFK